MKTIQTLCLFIILSVLFISCSHGHNVSNCLSNAHIYGFWGGLWHGIIAPFDLVAMIWSDTIVVYAPNNNGGWYAFGFCLGAGILGFGSSKAKK